MHLKSYGQSRNNSGLQGEHGYDKYIGQQFFFGAHLEGLSLLKREIQGTLSAPAICIGPLSGVIRHFARRISSINWIRLVLRNKLY